MVKQNSALFTDWGWSQAVILVKVVFFNLLWILARGFLHRLVYIVEKGRIPLSQCCLLVVINKVGNLVPMSAGFFAKGMILNKIHSLSYTSYAVSSLLLALATLGIANALAFFSGLILGLSLWLLLIFLCVFVLSIGLVFLAPISLLQVWRNRLSEGFFDVRASFRSSMLKIIFWLVISLYAFAMQLIYAYELVGMNPNLSHAFVLNTFNQLTRLISVLPAGIGIREGLTALMAMTVSFDIKLTVIAVGLDRVLSLVVSSIVVAIAWPFSHRLFGLGQPEKNRIKS